MEVQQLLIDAVKRADREGAIRILRQWASRNGYERLLPDVLEPSLSRIGEDWHSSESFTLSQAYVAARVVEDLLAEIAARTEHTPQSASGKRPAVIGNAEDDFHALGRRMVGIFLRAENWEIADLGNDALASQFVDKALEVGARVIGVSAMMLSTARNILRVRNEIDRRNLTGRIQLAVGGAIFRVSPGLAEEIGGDGTSANALGAADLFERLWQRSLAKDAAG